MLPSCSRASSIEKLMAAAIKPEFDATHPTFRGHFQSLASVKFDFRMARAALLDGHDEALLRAGFRQVRAVTQLGARSG
jgi:hypothetical protein